MSDLLSQAEIDALLNGMGGGDLDVGDAEEEASVYSEDDVEEMEERGIVKSYDLANQERIVRGRMPTLEMINERFARLLRVSIFNFLRRASEIFISSIQIKKFSDFSQGLLVPTSLTVIRVNPLRGKALIVVEPSLIFTAVDSYFGGGGFFENAPSEGKEFTQTEMRVVLLIIELIFKDLKEAWKPVMNLDFDYLSSEINPRFANIVEPPELVVVSTLHVDLEGGGGDIHIAMPYAMLEPIRDLLDVINSNKEDVDENWYDSLYREVMRVDIPVSSLLIEKNMSIRSVLQLKKGDVIPIDLPESVTLDAANVPIFTGKVGISEGNYAIQITDRIVT
ncbi:MAG: flagellar motor switch protein FliM [Methylococcales bacterium]|jgi:flagellar motor switch protein FliM|nr:flagellar motor switch protein FliM [Methylococcales bacterium]MCX7076201.1 flagellar motor switch protein FliM [Methylococcales bacterium]